MTISYITNTFIIVMQDILPTQEAKRILIKLYQIFGLHMTTRYNKSRIKVNIYQQRERK